MKINTQVLEWTYIFTFLGYSVVQLLGHMVSIHLILQDTAKVFSKVAVPFYFFISNICNIQFSASSLAFSIAIITF